MSEKDVGNLVSNGKTLPVAVVVGVDTDEFLAGTDEAGKFLADAGKQDHLISHPAGNRKNRDWRPQVSVCPAELLQQSAGGRNGPDIVSGGYPRYFAFDLSCPGESQCYLLMALSNAASLRASSGGSFSLARV